MQLQLSALLCHLSLSRYSSEDTFPARLGPSSVWRATHCRPPSYIFPLLALQYLFTLCPLIMLMLYYPSSTSKQYKQLLTMEWFRATEQKQTKNKSTSPYLLCFILLKYKDRWSNGRLFCKRRNHWFFSNRIHYWLIWKCYVPWCFYQNESLNQLNLSYTNCFHWFMATL